MLAEYILDKIVEVRIKICYTGVWPEDFTKAVMIPIPKKVNAVESADH